MPEAAWLGWSLIPVIYSQHHLLPEDPGWKRVGVVTLDQSKVQQASPWVLKTGMELSAHRGGFPVTGSCGLAFAPQSGSLTSCLREKTSQITQITWLGLYHGFEFMEIVPKLRACPSIQLQIFSPRIWSSNLCCLLGRANNITHNAHCCHS